MRLLDRYLFAEWVKVFFMMIVVATGLLILDDLYNNFGDFIAYRVDGKVVLWYYLLRFPVFLPIVLPLAILLSLLYVLGRWQRNHELTALRCAGLSLWRLTWSFWMMGAIFSGVLLYLNTEVIPRAEIRSQIILDDMRDQDQARRAVEEEEVRRHLTLRNKAEDRFWFVDYYYPERQIARGVRVQGWVGPREEGRLRTLVAREGTYDYRTGQWHLTDLRETQLNPLTGEVLRSAPMGRLTLSAEKESPTMMILLASRPKDLSVHQLYMVRTLFPDENDPQGLLYEVRYHGRWASTLICLMVVAIAIPFSISGVRQNPLVGVTKSVVLFGVFYVLLNLFQYLGDRGWVPGVYAAWIPVVALTLVGLIFFVRASRPEGA
ncbi:MAG: LptF/LptG family permease [Opitutales bacterium]|nr:LptF/LptG family permease [Opitutales bacterium]MCH8540324.1 LptF/LptG family permease [Opitutales bacterium]